MKFKIVIPANTASPGKRFTNKFDEAFDDPENVDYWPPVVQARAEWGDPVADVGTPYFLRDILVSKIQHVHNLTVHPLLLRLTPLTKDDIERDAERVKVNQGQILAARTAIRN